MQRYLEQSTLIKAILLFAIASNVSTPILSGITRIVPAFAHQSGVMDALASLLPHLLICLWFFGEMTIRKVDYWTELTEVSVKFAWRDLLSIVTFNVLAGLASLLILAYLFILFNKGLLDALLAVSDLSTTKSSASVLITAIAASLIAPISEEYIFRGLLFTNLQKRFAVWPAMFLTALIFAVMHFSPLSLITTFIFAMCSCIVYYKTKNLWLPILMHIAVNGVISLYEVGEFFFASGNAANSASDSTATVIRAFYFVGLPCLIVALGLGYYMVKQRRFLQLDTPLYISE